MPFMLLIVETPEQRRGRPLPDGQAFYARMLEYSRKLQARGVLLASHSLKSEAVRVHVRAGKPNVLDGPFTESKELIGGFFLLDCATQDQARTWAAQCPAAEWATIEIREVGPCYS
ncbi:MAG TPA: YciI family protein [Steroidobacteraceae bacterium]